MFGSVQAIARRLRRALRRQPALRRQWSSDPKAIIELNGEVIYRLPAPLSKNPSCLMFTQPKSGSQMVRGILRVLATQSGLCPTGPEGAFYKAGILRCAVPPEVFKEAGYFYHFSNFPTDYSIPIEAPTLVHVRDIRDILVSKYYSLRESHPEPGTSLTSARKQRFARTRDTLHRLDLDEGVVHLANPGLAVTIKGLREAADRPGALLTRYEDMVYRKTEWAKEVCRHFGWDHSDEAIALAVEPFDVFPDGERPDQHVRQVHPGNYKKKLKPETIERLNTMFKRELDFFGYEV